MSSRGRSEELRRLDDIDGLHDANVSLAKELRENEEVVKAARATKRKLKDTEDKLTKEKKTLETVRAERKSFYNDLRYHQQLAATLRQRIAAMGNVEELREEHEALWAEFDQLRQDHDNLRAELEEKNAEIERLRDAENPVIETRDSRGDYTPEFRNTVYQVVSANTPHAGVQKVFDAVLAFAGKKLSDFPTGKIVRNMGCERLDIGKQHVVVTKPELTIAQSCQS